MPFAGYRDFADCVSKNSDKENPEAYCGKIRHQVEGKLSGPLGWEPFGDPVWSEDQGYYRVRVERIPRPTGVARAWRWVIEDRISDEPIYGYADTRKDAERQLETTMKGLLGRAASMLHQAAPPPPPGAAAPDPLAMPQQPPMGAPGVSPVGPPPDRQSDKVVYVCPFCGSGNIVGNSDGSITCNHDNVTFTVEVKPSHPAMPLVGPNGEPFKMSTEDEYPEIGMASAPEGAQVPGAAPEAGGDSKVPADPENKMMPSDGAPGGSNKMPASGDASTEVPDFLKKSTFITSEGVALSGDSYVKHLIDRHLR